MATQSSNRKPGQAAPLPAEPFKTAVASCLKAIARTPDMEVAFAAEKPLLMGQGPGARARLPEPPRKLSAQDAAILRGHADSFGLRLALHDNAVHRRMSPESSEARAVFDAVEQARVEAIGSRRMEGTAGNINAMLEDRYHRSSYAEVTDRSEAPLDEALALMVRERLTGQRVPKGAKQLVEVWRDFIEEKAGADLANLDKAILDQRAFAKAVQKLLTSLDMGDSAASDQSENDEQQDSETETPDSPDQEQGEAESDQSMEGMELQETDAVEKDVEEGAEEQADAPSGEFPRNRTSPKATSRKRRAARRRMPALVRSPTTRPMSPSSTRRSAQKSFATPMSSTGCGAISTSSSPSFRALSAASPTGCSAGCWRSKAAPGSSTSRRVCSTQRGCRVW